MSEYLSECCTASPDNRFSFDEEYKSGICARCKEHAEFIKYEDD